MKTQNKMNFHFIFCFLTFTFINNIYCQYENHKWYFGTKTGLDFMNTPPSTLVNGVTRGSEGASTISDAAGNLLFYSEGDTIWNKAHQLMANGDGLYGHKSSTQSVLIVKQPGSATLFYVFTTDAFGTYSSTNYGFRYSIVDMSLAAGMGSVTIKNTLLHAPTSEKLAGTLHCNGSDVWVVSHDYNSTNFRAYLLSSSGLSVTPVLSSIGNTLPTGSGTSADFAGQLKFSPNGRKIGMALSGSNVFNLFDFDISTGVVSNSLTLSVNGTPGNGYGMYGCEFSPDGTKFYGSRYPNTHYLYQWDLCAGSNTAIATSIYTVFTNTNSDYGSMQLAPDGKIYISRATSASCKTLAVINNPNNNGVACNYVHNGLTVTSGNLVYSLPNMVKTLPQHAPYTFTLDPMSCTTVSFTCPVAQNTSTVSNCISSGYSLTGILWDFGDPASGAANTSTLANIVHVFTSNGTYTPQLTMYYTCGGGQQVLTQTLVLQSPLLSVANKTICAKEKVILIASGAVNYTWSTSSLSASISVSPSITSNYTVKGTASPSLCIGTKIVTVTVNKCTSLSEYKYSNASDIQLSPNPSSDNLLITFSGLEPNSIKGYSIINTLGLCVRENRTEPKESTISISISELECGLYQIWFQTEFSIISKKFIKIN